jgi:hypothetical protein
LGEKQIGFGGVLVFCNGASISLLDESIGYQAIESLPFTPIETFGLFHAPPGDDITKDRQFFVGDGDGFSHLTLHMSSRPSASLYFSSAAGKESAVDHTPLSTVISLHESVVSAGAFLELAWLPH